MQSVFVVGTDTGVGKTTVTAALLAALRARGHNLGVMKPVETGAELRDGILNPSDAHFLRAIAGTQDPIELVCPCRYQLPAAPAVAAEAEGVPLDWDAILEAKAELERRHGALLIEGAGGLMVPLDAHSTLADLIARMGVGVLVVARAGLGTLNHTLLTVQALRGHGIPIHGIILNAGSDDHLDPTTASNPGEIARRTGLPVFGTLPRLTSVRPEDLAQAAQQLDLETLIASLTPTRRTAAEWDESAKRTLWLPFTQMADYARESQLVIERGQGATLIDADGNAYLDGNSSLWVNIHGHRHPAIVQAIADQLTRLDHATMLGQASVPPIALGEALTRIAPPGLTRVFYSDNGSTAVEAALKMAFQYWQHLGEPHRIRYAALEGAYHGDTLGAVSVGGIDTFHEAFRPLLFEALRLPFPSASDWEPTLASFFEAHGETLAALVLEPLIQGAAGMRLMPRGYLRKVREWCDRYDVLLILDEVATGFGRTGTMFACEHEGVVPDLMAIAKGITGGFLPLAATLATERVYEAFLGDYAALKTFFHGHSYTGNPIACAAALASLELFEQEQTLARLQPRIRQLEVRFATLAEHPHVGEIRQCGFMAGVELVRDRQTGEAYPWDAKMGLRVCKEARQRGVILRPIGNTIVLMPPLTIQPDELDRIVDVLEASITVVTSEASLAR